MAAEKIPTTFFEIIDQRDSGFIREGTQGTPNEQQLRTPQVIWIPNTGFRCVMEEKDGITRPIFKEIRFIKNCNIIDKDEQDKRGIKPNPHNDIIEFRNGNKLISQQGSTLAEFDYLTEVFYNLGAVNRPDSATAIYRAVDLNKNAEILAVDDEDLERALTITNSLRTKTGSKTEPFKYNEERIEGICTILGVTGDSPATKLYTISVFAKSQPRSFLQKVENFEQHILTEVSHAIQLNVVMFDGNTAYLNNGNEKKVIREVGPGKPDVKMNKLADFLKTQEGSAALTELRILTAVAKDKELQ